MPISLIIGQIKLSGGERAQLSHLPAQQQALSTYECFSSIRTIDNKARLLPRAAACWRGMERVVE